MSRCTSPRSCASASDRHAWRSSMITRSAGCGPKRVTMLLQVEPVEQLHDVVEAAGVVHAEVVELHGVRRAQAGGDLRFALETPHELLVRRALAARRDESASRPPDARAADASRARPRPCRRSRAARRADSCRPPAVRRAAPRRSRARVLAPTRTARSSTVRSSRMLPGPRVGFEPRASSRATRRRSTLPSCRAMPAHEVIDERRDVLAPIGERRHGDAVAATECEEGVETAARRVARHIARRGRNHPHVGCRRLAACARRS